LSSRTSVARRWLAFVWLATVLVVGAYDAWVWFIAKRALDTDVLALLPAEERDPAVNEALAKVTDAAQQHVVVLVGSRDWASARRAAVAYRRTIDAHREWFRPDSMAALDQTTVLAPWWSHRAALLTAADRKALEVDDADNWTRAGLENLASPLGVGRIGAWQDDPFGLFRHWLQARGAETPARPVDGMLQVTDSGEFYVVLPITLAAQAFSTGTRVVVPVLDAARRAALNSGPGVRVLTAGVVRFAADAEETAQREMSVIGWGSIAGIVVLMWLAFRSPLPIGLIMLSLAVGMLGALAVSGVIFNRLHVITFVFGASLIGVAQDYSVLYLCQRLGDAGQPWAMMRKVLPALTFALGTTAIGYLGLALTPFPGLRQMAVFSAAGLLFAWITVVLWFPWLDRQRSRAAPVGVWLSRTIVHWPSVRWGSSTIVAVMIAAVVIGAGLARLRTNDDVRLLVNAPPRLVEEQQAVGRILRAPAPAQFFVVKGADPDAVLAREEHLRVRLDSMVATGRLVGYRAVSAWVPSLATQAGDRSLVEDRLYGHAGSLDRLAVRLGETGAWADAARTRLAATTSPLEVDDWLASPISGPYRNLWLGPVKGGWASVVDLVGVNAGNIAQLGAMARGIPGVLWVDRVASVSSLLGRYRRQMTWVVVASYAMLWVVMWPRYGRRTWRVLAPTAVGSVFTLAAFGLLGQPVELIDVLAFFLIFGMGVDYGIFLEARSGMHRYGAWLAVVLSAASAMLSFGLLSVSREPSLHEFGLTMLIGISVVALLTPVFCRGAVGPAD
jgi:predicted exporter